MYSRHTHQNAEGLAPRRAARRDSRERRIAKDFSVRIPKGFDAAPPRAGRNRPHVFVPWPARRAAVALGVGLRLLVDVFWRLQPVFVIVPPSPPDGGPQVCLGDRERIRAPCVSERGHCCSQ